MSHPTCFSSWHQPHSLRHKEKSSKEPEDEADNEPATGICAYNFMNLLRSTGKPEISKTACLFPTLPIVPDTARLLCLLRDHGLRGCLRWYLHQVERNWKASLSRQSRSGKPNWSRMKQVLNRYPLPLTRIVHKGAALERNWTMRNGMQEIRASGSARDRTHQLSRLLGGGREVNGRGISGNRFGANTS